MWNTEINYGLLGGDDAKQIPAARQASFVARTLLLNAASPIRRVYWYSWRMGGIANTHLVEDDRTTLTRAGRAWSVIRGWIVGTDMKSCVTDRQGQAEGAVHLHGARQQKGGSSDLLETLRPGGEDHDSSDDRAGPA